MKQTLQIFLMNSQIRYPISAYGQFELSFVSLTQVSFLSFFPYTCYRFYLSYILFYFMMTDFKSDHVLCGFSTEYYSIKEVYILRT